MKTRDQLIDELIDLAFAEDVGDGDHTTPVSYTHLSIITSSSKGRSEPLWEFSN